MNPEERLVADFRGTGLTVGPHPMAYHRVRMDAIGIRKASDLAAIPNGKYLRIGGCVIARQRPGTAKGFVFLSLEDETGVANVIIMPDLFQKNRMLVTSEQFLIVEGILQNQDNVISVKARRVMHYRLLERRPVRTIFTSFRCKRLPKSFPANEYFLVSPLPPTTPIRL
jgi:error-prone DNA polymerase